MEGDSGNANLGNLLVNKRPGNKNRQKNSPSRTEQQLTRRERPTKLPLVGALVHKALQTRTTTTTIATTTSTTITEQIEQDYQSNNNNNRSVINNNESITLNSVTTSSKNKMVLPFGLGHDDHHLDAIQTAPIPSAPPAHLVMPPKYSLGQTNIYSSVPIIVNPYIDFIVVNGDDRYMIRCERKSVLERSVELAKLIHQGPNSGRKSDNHFQISNVDKKDFELIVRYMESRFIRYRDHKHLLKLLELADRFNVPDLIIYCIRELDLNITCTTALDIFKALWFYQGIALTNQRETVITIQETKQQLTRKQAAKMKAAAEQAALTRENGGDGDSPQVKLIPNPNPFTSEDYGVALLHNTLQLIDMQAELVLALPAMKDLRFEELETIVKRDTLQIRSEITLFECLASWSLAECTRKNLDPTPENRRTVLGPLCLTPRYLRMKAAEFRFCCARTDLLPPIETMLVSESLEGKKLRNLTEQQLDLLAKFRSPRTEYAQMPVYLSDRTSPKNYPKKMRLLHEGRQQEEGCWEKAGMNCLRAFVCIFD